MMLRPDVEYNTPLKPCKIKIDEILYSAVMQEHRLISEEINVNREIITDCTSIRKYILRSRSLYSNQNLLWLNVTMGIIVCVICLTIDCR